MIGLKAKTSPLTTPVTKDKFGWLDDSPLTFDRWAHNQPENVIVLEYGVYDETSQGWVNLAGANEGDALCEIE